MSQILRKAAGRASEPEPAWDIAYLFPPKGQWTEEDYLDIDTNRLVELSDGTIEVLPMPTSVHQLVLIFLFDVLRAFTKPQDLGEVFISAFPVRLWRGKFREPDVLFMLKEHASRMRNEFWKGADLVMEVVSEGREDRKRDYETKRREYARAGIPEYWIVDPQDEKITVLRLSGKRYVVHGEFGRGTDATSHVLPGFTVDVTAAFSQPRPATARKAKRRRP